MPFLKWFVGSESHPIVFKAKSWASLKGIKYYVRKTCSSSKCNHHEGKSRETIAF